MGLKKKMSMGILAGALGVSLIGGGTWAAFNDVETVENTFAAGTLDLVVGESSTMNFTISNLKPGDYFTKQLVLQNNGSLDINQINLHASKQPGWENKDAIGLNSKVGAGAGDNTEEDFLSQFKIEITPSGGSTPSIYSGTLKDLATGTAVTELTGTDDQTTGLAAKTGEKTYDVKVTFVPDNEKFNGTRLYKQNKYQDEKSNLKFVFEATQMPGQVRDNN